MDNQESFKKLYRSKSDRYIGGVAGGLGRYFTVDANIFRILFVVFSFIGGIGILLYLAALFLVPENPIDDEIIAPQNRTKFFALLFIILGIFLLLRNMGFFEHFRFLQVSFSNLWAILLIGIGLLLILSSRKSKINAGSDESTKSAGSFFPDISEIYRSESDKMIAGVCAGIARYFKIDPSIVRILWVIASLGTIGFGILVYILLIFILPLETEKNS
jgi:phage shock protein C